MKPILIRLGRAGLTLHVLKTALAAGLSWLAVTHLTQNPYPYFAALGAILTVQVTVADSIQKGIQRVIGIIGGVSISMLIGHFMQIGAVSIALVVLLGMAISTALKLPPGVTSQVAVSSLLVLGFGHAPGYATGRIIETVVGCIIAILVNAFFVPPNAIPKAEEEILRQSQQTSDTLRHLAKAWADQTLSQNLPVVRQLVDQTGKSYTAVKLAGESLKYSPLLRERRVRFRELISCMNRFEHITVLIRGIARGLVDMGSDVGPQFHSNLKLALEATATCVSLFGKTAVGGTEDATQMLRVAVEQARTRQSVCWLELQKSASSTGLRDMSAILTGLNRILKEVSGEAFVATGNEFLTEGP